MRDTKLQTLSFLNHRPAYKNLQDVNKNPLKILFLEDVPSDVDLAVAELKKEKINFEHTTICTRGNLIKILNKFKPDLIISDYMMPSFNGLEALRIVKDFDSEIPFILLTGSMNEETAVICLKAGADDYVIKEHITRLPFAVKEVLGQAIIRKEKKASELLLKESEEKFRSIAENLTDIIFIINTYGIVQYVSPSSESFGYSVEEITGNFFGEFLADGEIEKAMQQFNNVLNSVEHDNTISLVFKRKDGSNFFAELTGSIFNIDNETKGVLGLLRDISDKRQREDELRKLSRSVEQSPASIVIADTEGNIEYVNPKLCELTGFSKDELIGKNPRIFSSGEKAKDDYKILWDTIKAGNDWKGKFRNKKKNGDLYWESASISPIKNEKNEVTHFLGTKEDITEQIKASEQMRLAKEKAEASDKLKTNFLNNISHEIRTPLNGILGFAEIITQTDLSEDEKRDSHSMLKESSDRLLNTITNYMDISLLTSGSMSVNKKDFVPGQILKRIFDRFNDICLDRNLRLSLDIPVQLANLAINSDPEIFQKTICHLLNNAIKFTEKGSINFGVNLNEKVLEFFVRDTGVGIRKESFKSIFDRFVKEERGPSMLTEGSGLGLSIALGMSRILGGNIRLESELGAGTCFYLSIPFNKVPEISKSFNIEKDIRKVYSGSQILVAEDEETNFNYLKAILSRETGATILHAENGKKAIELFKANPDIKLILMDLKMPEMDGYEAARQIKLLNKEIPIIAITAFAMSGDEDKALAAGCDGYLSKPISKKILMEKIAEFVTLG